MNGSQGYTTKKSQEFSCHPVFKLFLKLNSVVREKNRQGGEEKVARSWMILSVLKEEVLLFRKALRIEKKKRHAILSANGRQIQALVRQTEECIKQVAVYGSKTSKASAGHSKL